MVFFASLSLTSIDKDGCCRGKKIKTTLKPPVADDASREIKSPRAFRPAQQKGKPEERNGRENKKRFRGGKKNTF